MRKLAAASFVIALLFPLTAMAQPDPIGQELQVNTRTAGYQYSSSVSMNDAGQFVVVWSGAYYDGDGYGIFGRTYDSLGNPVGGTDFQINDYTPYSQFWARVGMDRDGDFVVVWSGAGPGDYSGVFVRRFNSSGTPKDFTDYKVNTYTNYIQQHPSIAVNPGGRFVVVWAGTGPGDYDGIFARRFDRFGNPNGSQFRINDLTSEAQRLPAVGMDLKGRFVVAWQADNLDGNLAGVAARRFQSDGTPRDAQEFQVNTWTTGSQTAPGIAVGGGGAFIIAWTSIGQDDPPSAGIAARRFKADGTPKDAEDFLVNAITMNNQVQPNIGMDKSGGFVVSWHDYSDYLMGTGYEIRARRFTSAGTAVEVQEFSVNSYTEEWQTRPSVSMNRSGQFVISWDSAEQDGDQGGVFAQKLDCEDTDDDALCDPLDIIISSHVDGDSVNCSTPGVASTRPRITWQKGNYDKFRAMISWDPSFPSKQRITSGSQLIKKNNWKPTRKQWARACKGNRTDLFIRVFGVDNQLRSNQPHKHTISNDVGVTPQYN